MSAEGNSLQGKVALVTGGSSGIGAAVGYFTSVPQRIIAAVMAFGSGVLISALAFDLMDEAYGRGGFASTAAGFLCPAQPSTPPPTGCWRGRGRSTASVPDSSSVGTRVSAQPGLARRRAPLHRI